MSRFCQLRCTNNFKLSPNSRNNVQRLLPRRRRLTTVSNGRLKDPNSIPMSNLEKDSFLPYTHLRENLTQVRRRIARPLTLSEKMLYSHLCDPVSQVISPGKSFLKLYPDRVAIHDANATMTLLRFMSAGIEKVALPTTIHTDHLTMAEKGAEQDLAAAKKIHREVFEFLASASARYGIGFWKPGSGIIHTIIFENYAFPGSLLVGTDSHTPNAAGMSMLGIGVGGSDAVDAMAGLQWGLPCPKVLGVRLAGKLSGWASSKDIICKLAGLVSVTGGKGKIVEFFGPGVDGLGATAMTTIGNIQNLDFLTPDERSDSYYDDTVEINLDALEPHINGPYTPDLSHPLSKLGQAVEDNNWPEKISASLVGSCTNSSFEDLIKVSGLIKQANKAGFKMKTPFFVSTGSEHIRATAEDAGFLDTMRKAGAMVLSSSCGPCVGQWNRTDVSKVKTTPPSFRTSVKLTLTQGKPNSVISSFNRNFTGRHDGNPGTHSFVTSPELAIAFAYHGSLDFNPSTDTIPDPHGNAFKFQPPNSDELPSSFNSGKKMYQAPFPLNYVESLKGMRGIMLYAQRSI
ncbi:related to mitochondrial aconitate hydratase [Phialocephala subalpina]|uniref:Related to mitochondrial aconitate hydratase n=1 Tax=Phialocephala subalpina TaxID=576137 RepID=A0A1L7WGV1_9HELO|nr:related to mitochondrial aconitate hydratase [Phialocephala subalpina]